MVAIMEAPEKIVARALQILGDEVGHNSQEIQELRRVFNQQEHEIEWLKNHIESKQ